MLFLQEQVKLLLEMKIKHTTSIILLSTVLLGCSQKVNDSYYQTFYQDRQEQLIDLVSGEHAPLAAEDLAFISHFPYDRAYRVRATFSHSANAQPFDMATYSGKTKQFIEIGVLKFQLNNQNIELHVYQNLRFANHPVYGQYYFIPYKDDTNSEETYGGGRYIDLNKTLFDSKTIILDLNKTYNPWCAYSDGFNCPIPPLENHLSVAIRAGEKMFQKEKDH